MQYLGHLFMAFIALFLGAVLYAWWQKVVNNRPDRYGKGLGHDQRGMERGQTGFILETRTPKK